ncbi:ATPase AAA [Clostridium acetobutylicum]|nr:ATPase AAA [Clostridium acetobutylicum]
MDTKIKVKELFSYLLSIKNMNEDVIRDVGKYDKLYWKNQLKSNKNIVVNLDNSQEIWLEIRKENKELYDSFFQLYLRIQKNNENIEIVCGNYMLSWCKDDRKIFHPIFTTKMELSFDAENAKFILKPYDNKTILELDMFSGIAIPNMDEIIKVKEEFEKSCLDIREMKNVKDILYKVTHYLSAEINPKGEIQKHVSSINSIKPSKYPVFYDEAVIIVRKTDNRLWNKELLSIIDSIEDGYPIPAPIKALVETQNIEENNEEVEAWKKINDNLLFPLHYNEEQKEIVKKLSDNFGVVVQGPPGTGKSHTIVNLICHLLANGKRVLVTSQTGRALRVLSDKIPKEVKPLCISLLGDDTKSLKDLDDSVRRITENLSLNPSDVSKEIKPLENELMFCRKYQEKTYSKIKELECIENKKLNIGGRAMTLMEIAKWVNKNEKQLNWIEDEIPIDLKCPFTNQQFGHFIYLLNNVGIDDLQKVNSSLKVLGEVPEYEEILRNFQNYTVKDHSKDKINLKGWAINYKKEVNIDHDKVIQLIDRAESKMEEIEKSWLKNVMTCYYFSDIERPEIKNLFVRSSEYIRRLSDIQTIIVSHKITMPEDMNFQKFSKDFKSIYTRAKNKGKINKFFKIRHRNLNYIFNECAVDGEDLQFGDKIEILKLFLEKVDIQNKLMELWNSSVRKFKGDEIKKFDSNTFIKLEKQVKDIGDIVNWNANYKNKILLNMENITFLNKMDWYKKETYTKIKKGVISIKSIAEYEKAKAFLNGLVKLSRNTYGMEPMAEAIESRDIKKIKKAYSEVQRLKNMVETVKEINSLKNKIEKIAPIFTSKLLNSEKRSQYKNLNAAWKWKQMNDILEKSHRLKTENLEEIIENEKIKERVLIRRIVSKKAWLNEINSTTDIQKRSLYAWLQAVKRIGRGTGKFVLKYRKMAQMEMEKCKDCIPVWIMPLNKVIENIGLNSNLFDVVIFDESNQSDIFGISALFRGKRAVIVGDDKQISPQAVGIEEGSVDELINRHLKGIPHSQWFDLQTSLYNTALRVFPDRLLLREHFRCVPEIIGFSNMVSYSNEIIPLRYPKAKEAFSEPVKVVKVKDGLKDNIRQTNENEAKAIVNSIIECCSDTKYDNMTMGVISLLGEQQSELIESMLRHKLGEKEMLKRKILCGDAFSFQGDERDIMFLSLVVSNGSKISALTREADLRRFNVAASRARNQMWVFYSVDEDKLSDNCVRTKFLRYCLDPALNKNKINKEKMVLADEFEKDVFNNIRKRGYNVKPFDDLRKYKVDFIIEDASNRIAIACDSGNYNDLENWEKQRERQMALERVGWKFYRLKGSEFYRNPELTMDALCGKLENMGIKSIIT